MKTVVFQAQEAMELMRRHDLTLAERGLWLTCLLLMAQYPGKPNESEYFTEERLAKLVGSRKATVAAGMDSLCLAEIMAHSRPMPNTTNGPLFNGVSHIAQATGKE